MGVKKGSTRRVSDVPVDTIIKLESGIAESSNLSEMFTINFTHLLENVFSTMPITLLKKMDEAKTEGFLTRIKLGAQIIFEYFGDREKSIVFCQSHSSDIVRGFACYIVGMCNEYTLEEAINKVRLLANDPHFGVREWAWLGIRNKIVAEPEQAIKIFTPWVYDESAYIRRFASEATRPRGVWCSHIPLFKEEPEKAYCLLEPLNTDSSKYVRDSVANWLNDASKSKPEWVKNICEEWQNIHPTKETISLCKRALRSITKNTRVKK